MQASVSRHAANAENVAPSARPSAPPGLKRARPRFASAFASAYAQLRRDSSAHTGTPPASEFPPSSDSGATSRRDLPARPSARLLRDLSSIRRLAWKQERFDEFTFTAHGETRKLPEPFAFGNVWLGVQPARQQNDLFGRKVPLTHPRQKMNEQGLRQFEAADFRPEVCRRRIRARCPLAAGRPPQGLWLRPFVW